MQQSTTVSTTTGPISWTVQEVTEDFFVRAGDHGTLRPVLNALTTNLLTYLLTYILNYLLTYLLTYLHRA